MASLNVNNDAYETKQGDGSSIGVAIYEHGNNEAISNSITFDANSTAHVAESDELTVDKSAKIAYVGFRFCATFNGSLYTLYSEADCSGTNEDCNATTEEGADPEWHICYASDQLAIRPEKFNIVSPEFADDEDIDLLRSGKDYNFSVTATCTEDGSEKLAFGYDQNKSNLDIEGKLLDQTGVENDALEGEAHLGENNFYFTDGNSTDENNNHEVLGLTFSDVGKVELTLIDKNWAAVDSDDTPEDCEGGVVGDVEVPEGMYVCGKLDTRFIPDHFELVDVNVTNRQKDQNFTYLSSDLNMSAHLEFTIQAVNAQGEVTKNFKENNTTYYENHVAVNVIAPKDVEIPNEGTKTMTVVDHNVSRNLLGFGGDDDNGTHNIAWDDDNETQRVMFNYERDNDTPINPFEVNGSDVNVTVDSIYVGASKTATIKGTEVASEIVTFQYARAKATKELYITHNSSIKTPVKIEVYCSQWPVSAANCPEVERVEGQTNDHKWFISMKHNMVKDGNITLKVEAGTSDADVTADVAVTQGIDTTINTSNSSSTLPRVVNIELDEANDTDSSKWLIYNPESSVAAPTPFYKVQFVGSMDWAGEGKTGKVIDNNASQRRTQRLGW